MKLKFNVLLGSGSPRRRDLLDSIQVRYSVVKPDILEQMKSDEPPKDYVLRNSHEKSQAVLQRNQPSEPTVIISADTIVEFQNQIIEKPKDKKEAFDLLSMLSNQTHQVSTGFVLLPVGFESKTIEHCVSTKVSFREISDQEIHDYIATGEPMDKAGGYGAQGYGAAFIRNIAGSYTNVVGLPICEVFEGLIALNNDL
jgi:septum formation protein